jgi:hypothetical protein
MGVDPLWEKYPGMSPYAYCADNPVKYIDTDGEEIILVEYRKRNITGQLIGSRGDVSKTTMAALTDMLKTDEGMNYLSQYAKTGDKIGDYTFSKEGKYSDRTLRIEDMSYSEVSGQIIPSGIDGSYKTVESKEGKITTTIEIFSIGMDKYDAAEALSHEMLLHGYDPEPQMDKKAKASKDHQALKSKDSKHKGYRQYNNIRTQLKAIDKKYDNAFKQAEKHAQENY